jgi:uracil-DNA glycosylase family 4
MITELTNETVEAIYRGDATNTYARQYPVYPLTAPGMPPAGPNFIAHARALGDDTPWETKGTGAKRQVVGTGIVLRKLYLRALYESNFDLPIKVKGLTYQGRLVPGHIWGGEACGPVYLDDEYLQGKPRVMVIGKMPGNEEIQQGRNLVGPSGATLRETFEKLGVPSTTLDDWYVCNLVRWGQLSPTSSSLAAAWIKDCLPLLHQELRLVRPDYILCLGAEATKAMCGHSVRDMIGRAIELQIPIHEEGEEAQYHTAQVMSAVHPAAVLRTTERYPQFLATCKNFAKLIGGNAIAANSDATITVQCIYKERELAEVVDRMLQQPGIKKIAVDGEWHGQHPGEPGSYLRTIQVSHHGRYAAVVVLRHQGGEPAFRPGIESAIEQLNRLLDRDDVQIGGSFFSADLPWLEYSGLHIAHRFTVPPDVEDIRGGNYAGGMDVALAQHAYNETADFKLEVMATRYCGADRWDVPLQQWKREYLAEHKMKDAELEGYGECPDEILLPYGGKDAAYTRQLMDVHCRLLDGDRFGNDCWVPFHISMMAFPAFNEMGMVGVKVDRERIDALTDAFEELRTTRLAELRHEINWPGFNPRSAQQCVEFLFGEQYSTKRDAETGERISVRPAGALSLYMSPVKTTGKGRPWAWVQARGEVDKYAPSTDKEVCGILGAHHPLARKLRDVRLIDQVLTSVFRSPEREGNKLVLDDAGRRVYVGGIAKYICYDDRVRSTFQQVKETGRASSARPPLQNISKRREDDYARIFGERYQWPIRSFITSNTDMDYGEPTVLLEADYKGAELLGMAVMSRDERMLDHCLRANLPDDDSNQYDIHSNIAVTAFRLDCEPTKAGLASIGAKGKRVAAKNIIFGVGYGRTAEACARQCQEEAKSAEDHIDATEAQIIIDTIFATYPGVPALQEKLRARVHKPGWLRNCFGRLRRFITTSDRAAMGELERQALNFPFQSMVADAVSYALYHLKHHPRKAELGYRIVLQIHDAIVLEVPVRSLNAVYDEIMPACMVDRVSFRACDLDGVPFPDSPVYRFGIDRDVVTRWGLPLSWDECDAIGIERKYGKAPKKAA